jgi:hypothetical protein
MPILQQPWVMWGIWDLMPALKIGWLNNTDDIAYCSSYA